MSTEFTPYWLIHEPGKSHGIGTVELWSASTQTKALEVWRDEQRDQWAFAFDVDTLDLRARLILEPFVP